MKFIEEYSEYEPQDKLVDEYRTIIDDKYKVIKDSSTPHRMVLVDDRLYYLSGPYGYKSKLVNKMFFDLTYDTSFHEPSLRKAIKNWIDDNSK